MEPFDPTGLDMHYRTTNVYYEMLSCISDCKKNLCDEINTCDALRIQIDDSCDRQQLGIKFVTARLVKNGTISKRFLTATEPVEKGANGLMEALGRRLKQPGDVSSHVHKLMDNPDDIEKDDCLIDNTKMLNFKAPVFDKLLSLSTDGEANAELWRKLNYILNRLVPCIMVCVIDLSSVRTNAVKKE